MKSTSIRRAVCMAVLTASILCAWMPPPASAAAPGTQPATQPKRSVEEISRDLSATGQQLQAEVGGSPQALMDPDKRATLAAKVIPAMYRMLALFDELGEVEPRAKAQAAQMRAQIFPMLALLGDERAAKSLADQAASADPKEAAVGKAALLLVKWWQASKDAGAQGKLLDEATAMAKAAPEDDSLARLLMMMKSMGAATPELGDRAQQAVVDNLKSPMAQQIAEQAKAEQKLKSLEGKPLTIEGMGLDGKQFSTAQWKGKVILVDFWATWCGPCLGELPRVKKAYATWHDKGLEVLGVSCDRDEAALKDFLAKDKEMAWPQLFDAAKPGWHPLATQFGINGIPTMFLIDKAGIVRTVNAREDFETLIPKMLEEN